MEYHRLPRPGKISIAPTKTLINQHDLSLAYSPCVAAACDAIAAAAGSADAHVARQSRRRGHQRHAVLGLGNIGRSPASRSWKARCLFKKFAASTGSTSSSPENDPEELVKTIAGSSRRFGGINLEDIKAPDCFYVERKLRERMKIPVFHDDQHGTAIVAGAFMLNGLKLVDKDIAKVKLVCSGAGAAAIACLDLMVGVGLKRENVVVCDSDGVIWASRESPRWRRTRRARPDTRRARGRAIAGADIFSDCRAEGCSAEMVKAGRRR